MNQLDQQVARRLTRFYVMALTVIALLLISGLLLFRYVIRNHYGDSRVVNIAGRQRMLSQRLTKLSLLRSQNTPTPDTASFDSLFNLWQKTHVQLQQGTLHPERGSTIRSSAKLDSMFTAIDPSFQSLVQSFNQINNPASTDTQRNEALRSILRHEHSYVLRMNDIVFQIDAESLERVKTLERIEFFITLAALLALLIEGFFIFRPVVNYTQNVVRRLDKSEKNLRQANNRLEITNHALEETNRSLVLANRKLVETQQELLQTTEEKYQLQLAESLIRAAALLEGQEEERRRFARELHDGIGQMLTGLKLHAEKLKSGFLQDDKQRARVEDVCELIYDTIQTTRQVAYNLMPSVLSDFGLQSALKVLADQTTRASGIDIVFESDEAVKRLTPATEIGLYRIAQEALHNAVKYAEAQLIRIQLQIDRQKITLAVTDDGKGFAVKIPKDENQLSINRGLDNMHTRARLLNGELIITSKMRKGTKVLVRVRHTLNPN
ncbi:histidine kinase [Spirosoma sp. KUDC1026]|uniref:ATP-binding protein n=1 Tax=Spirosoma sp. KUDC1026 TaxID=2745947 RepID=UPI00159B96BA|nr:histidine kinase [Spirosoma sp. KUDC1026]QKZ12983.1 type IV pili methyl-accepting chemotaxis transducer N-terminal domain-containing protein [Spirosoma sp. KUDC1026]